MVACIGMLGALALVMALGCGPDSYYKETVISGEWLETPSIIQVSTFNGSVRISSWEGDYVRVEGEKIARGLFRNELVRAIEGTSLLVEKADNILKIVASRPSVVSPTVFSLGVSLNISIPKGLNKELQVETSNGRIDVSDLDGPLILRSSNGKIVVEGGRVILDARTSNAGIIIWGTELLPGFSEIKTSNGSVNVNTLVPEHGTIDMTTSNANIECYLHSTTDARIAMKTSNGEVRISDLSFTAERLTRERAEGRLNAGGDLKITLSTSNGSILLAKSTLW